mmetsp:Transcript_20233/g.59161  ORF Transcript_20233/g.59161 Transcript_20233/m.59161 type:complete len:331 (-) Transcript_20233:180-1172(-)
MLLRPPLALWFAPLVLVLLLPCPGVEGGSRRPLALVVVPGFSGDMVRPAAPSWAAGRGRASSGAQLRAAPRVSTSQDIQEVLLENSQLARRVAELEEKNRRLSRLVVSEDVEDQWCEVLEDGVPDPACEEEPLGDFLVALRSRAAWLIGLLAVQSASSFILAGNEALIQRHPAIVYFLTMLVGAGGNAGNQSAVRIIRGLATGTITKKTQWQFLWREVKMAFSIAGLLGVVGFFRVILFGTCLPEAVSITLSLVAIVVVSVITGAFLPILLEKIKQDAAHASTTVQVVMDISGVLIVCGVSAFLLDQTTFLTEMLGGGCTALDPPLGLPP